MLLYIFNDYRIHEKLVIHCQDAKASVFEQLCDKFLQCSAFESLEQTRVSIMCNIVFIIVLWWSMLYALFLLVYFVSFLKFCLCFVFCCIIMQIATAVFYGSCVILSVILFYV